MLELAGEMGEFVNRISMGVALGALLLFGISTLACAPVGSERWCQKMDDKPKGDWSSNEAIDYAKHCVLR